MKVTLVLQNDGVTESVDFELEPATRRAFDVADISSRGPEALLVQADGDVVVEHLADFGVDGRSLVLGVPVSDTSTLPDPLGD